MTTTTYTHMPSAKPGASFGGRLKRFFWRMIEAREKAVARRIASHFQGLDNEHLVKLGYDPSDIERLRRE